MRTLLYIFSLRNAKKRKQDLFFLKHSASCAKAKNNLLKHVQLPHVRKLRFTLQIAECPPLENTPDDPSWMKQTIGF